MPKQEVQPIEEWARELNVDKLLRNIIPHIQNHIEEAENIVKNPEVMKEGKYAMLKRHIYISLRQWYIENTEE